MAIALIFGLVSIFNYKIGEFARSGPGMFPLLVSCLLFLIGVLTLVRSFFVEAVALHYNLKNIALILLGLCGFVLLSQHVDMVVGILFLVFSTSFAGSSFSWLRNVKICVVLIAIAYVFKYGLGLNLPLTPIPTPITDFASQNISAPIAKLFNQMRGTN